MLGHFYFFPSLYFKEIRTESYLPERMLRIGSFHAADFFDMGKKFYPLGIEAYKRLLKAYGNDYVRAKPIRLLDFWGISPIETI